MKISSGNKQHRNSLRPTLHHSTTPPLREYSIRKHISFWHLTFNGQKACFDHEQGAYYVAYLLLNPPEEPIHGMALEIKSLAYFGLFSKAACETEIINPSTGETMILAADAILQQRNFALDDAASRRPLLRKIDELEAILENPHASEPVKAVRLAIYRFHRRMENAQDARGNPHPILRPFAAYIKQYLLIPTSRYCTPGGATTGARLAGRFTYEPPANVQWTA